MIFSKKHTDIPLEPLSVSGDENLHRGGSAPTVRAVNQRSLSHLGGFDSIAFSVEIK